MRTEDGHIVYKCLNGEPEAFGFLVDKYKGAIYAFAYAKLRNFHDAEDVTQEVFIKAYQKLRTLRRWDSVLAWLYSITSNLCKNWIRSRASRPDREFVEDQSPGALARPSVNSYLEGVTRESLLESLQEALDSLPEIYSQVLTLYYLGGMSNKEIARFLGTSSDTVRQRLTRARSQLKEEMLASIDTTFEEQKLRVDFTFRIVEAVKWTKIHPAPRTAGLPWGLSLATGIIIAILSLGSHLNLPNLIYPPLDSLSPGEAAATESGEMPVDILKLSRTPVTSIRQAVGDSRGTVSSNEHNAFLLAPRGEGDILPEEPAVHLGKGRIGQVAHSPDGTLLAVAGAGIRLYDADNLNEIRLLEGDTPAVDSVAFSPDGRILASGDGWGQGDAVRLWDVQEQKQTGVLEGHTDYISSIAFSPDGKILASASDDETVRLWDIQTQEQMRVLRGHTNPVKGIDFSPDGKLLASCSADETVRLWDVQTQEQVGVLKGHTAWVYGIAFSPDGKLLASCSADETVRLWDVQTQEQVGVLKGHTSRVYGIAFSPDGKLLASYGDDRTVRLWDVQTQEQAGALRGHTSWVCCVSFNPDGKTLASSSWVDATLRVWDIQTQEQVELLQGYTNTALDIAFSPDGKVLASAQNGGMISLWDVKDQEQIGVLRGHTDSLYGVAFSPDGKLLASGGYDKTVRLWDVQEQKQVGLLQHSNIVPSLAFSPDGRTLFTSGGGDRMIHIWDVERQKEVGVLKGHTDRASLIAFSPDGETIASGGEDNTVRLWDVQGESQIATLQGHTGLIFSVAFSPDGRLVASGSKDNTVRLWDVNGQNQIGVLQHASEVYRVTFSPDGKILSSTLKGGPDHTVHLWDVQKQTRIGVLQHKGTVFSAAFSPDGKWLASGSVDGTISLWEMNIPVQDKPVEPTEKQLGTWGEAKGTELLQNFPNPFNPDTWIPYQLSEGAEVTIRIYTSTGQLVRTLDLGQKPSGAYLSKHKAAYWDGRNEKGEFVASGVYFYVLKVGSFTQTRKMTVVR